MMLNLEKNEKIIKIDFSDSEINDEEGQYIVKYMKNMAEKRDNALWMTGLR